MDSPNNFISAVKDMHRKMNSVPPPEDMRRLIIDAQKALIEAMRTDPKFIGSRMTGNGKK